MAEHIKIYKGDKLIHEGPDRRPPIAGEFFKISSLQALFQIGATVFLMITFFANLNNSLDALKENQKTMMSSVERLTGCLTASDNWHSAKFGVPFQCGQPTERERNSRNGR